MDNKLIGGLIAVIFLVLSGTYYFYPYFTETDVCRSGSVYGSWEAITDVVHFNATFPSIARYYCDIETSMSQLDCLKQDKLINNPGCKWGGKTSKRNANGMQTTLYVMEDPVLDAVSSISKLSGVKAGSVVYNASFGSLEIVENYCSSPVNCRSEFLIKPKVNVSIPKNNVVLSSDNLKGGVGSFKMLEKNCVSVPVYSSKSVCTPYDVQVIANATQIIKTVDNCTIVTDAFLGNENKCSENEISSLSLLSGVNKTIVIKGSISPNSFVDWKINISGFSPDWAFWNSSWDCYVNLSAYESSGIARTYAFTSKNFNPVQEWNTCAVPYNASVRLLEYLSNGSYGEITSQISNSSVNATGYMNNFNLNWQNNFTAFENKTYVLYVKYTNDPIGYANPFTLATTVGDNLEAYRVNGTDFSFVFDDDFQLTRIASRQDGTMAMQGQPTTVNDVSLGMRYNLPLVKNTGSQSDSLYQIVKDGAVFREVLLQYKGINMSWIVYNKGQYLDYRIAKQNSSAPSVIYQADGGTESSGVALSTKVFWNETAVTDPAITKSVSSKHGYVGGYGNGNEVYSPSIAFDETTLNSFSQGANLTMTVWGGAGEWYVKLASSDTFAFWNFEDFKFRFAYTKTDGSNTIAETRDYANKTYQDIVNPVTVGKLGEGSTVIPNTAPTIVVEINQTVVFGFNWINASAIYYDVDLNSGTVYFNLTVNGTYVSQFSQTSVANGTSVSFIIDPNNYSLKDNLSFKWKAYDGTVYATNSTNVTVSEYRPAPTITLVLPAGNISIVNGTSFTARINISTSDPNYDATSWYPYPDPAETGTSEKTPVSDSHDSFWKRFLNNLRSWGG